jgi:hypothetical protein
MGLSQLLSARAMADSGRSPSAEQTFAPASNVIMVWLAGGPATIDMWDMKPEAPPGIRGEFMSIPTSADGVRICEHLPKLATAMRHCTLVRSCNHTLAAHGPGTRLLMTGNRPSPAIRYPSLGSIASRRLPPNSGVPSFVALGDEVEADGGYLGAAENPFRADVNGLGTAPQLAVGLPDGFTVDDLHRRRELLAQFDQRREMLDRSPVMDQLSKFQRQALEILASKRTREALDRARETEAVRDEYGGGPIGPRLLAARRLVEAGVRFVTVGMTGWDTHTNNFGTLRNQLLLPFDRALSTLLIDLERRGLLDSTVVYRTGEFGRTPSVNGGAGRDHWARASSCLLAGGPLRRGYVHGATDRDGHEPVESACTPMDISATVLESIGIAPHTQLHTPTGRPLAAIGEGRAIDGLFS